MFFFTRGVYCSSALNMNIISNSYLCEYRYTNVTIFIIAIYVYSRMITNDFLEQILKYVVSFENPIKGNFYDQINYTR